MRAIEALERYLRNNAEVVPVLRGTVPGSGVSRDDRIYCCDKCAAGPNAKSIARTLFVMGGLVSAGAMLGWIGRATTPLSGWTYERLARRNQTCAQELLE